MADAIIDANFGQTQSFPVGLIIDDTNIACLTSPITPFEFPFDPTVDQYFDSVLGTLSEIPSNMDSVTRVINNPRVCELNGDTQSKVRTLHPSTDHRFSSMVDGGANICLTGTLSLLVDTVSLPPMPISVAIEGAGASIADCCTQRSLLQLQLVDGGVYFQPCYYCENAVETIISPQAILDASDTFVEWLQTGYKDNSSRMFWFYSASGLASMTMTLNKRDGLYYTHTDALTVDKNPFCRVALMANWLATPPTPKTRASHNNYAPVSKAAHTEAELWMVWLGSPGDDQLDMLPGNVTGIPSEFYYHPFQFINFKQQARIRKQAAQCTAVRTLEAGKQYYMDFGFMQASCSNYRKPNPKTDQVVQSWDGYSSYLLIVDEVSCFMWVFLTKSKDPPVGYH